MNNKKQTKKALCMSVLSMVLCVAMLVGMTFAWFTDTASTGVNTIQAGKLKIELQMKNADGNWVDAKDQTLTWQKATGHEAEAVLWEPGAEYKLQELRIVNKGDLKLKYKVAITGITGDAKLNEVIDWTMNGFEVGKEYTLDPTETTSSLVISGKMKTSAGNEYQGLSIDGIAVTVYATQATGEFDSTTDQYDKDATYPIEILAPVNGTLQKASADATAYTYANSDKTITASVPADAVTEGQTPTITIKPTDVPETASTTIKADGKDAIAYDIKVENATLTNNSKATVSIFVGKGLQGVEIYHNADKMTSGYSYDENTGIVTITTDTFSPFTISYEAPVAAIDGKAYYSLKQAFSTGGDITVMRNVETKNSADTEAARIVINKKSTVTLNGKVISPDDMGNNNKNFAAVYVDADTTINANSNGGIDTGTNGGYGINVRNGATLTINGGSYYGGGTAVQVQKGTLIINDGTFACEPYSDPKYGYKFLINCVDAAYKDGTAKIIIQGGTFVNFDPSNSASENPKGNFVADGYKVVSETQANGDVWYTVVKE